MTTKNRTVAALRAHLTRAKAKNDRKAAKALRARIKAVEAGHPDPGAVVKLNGTPARSLAALRARRTIMIQASNGHAVRKLNKRIKTILIENPKLDGAHAAKRRRTIDPQSGEARAKARDILTRLTKKTTAMKKAA